jgi:hypothetical protein
MEILIGGLILVALMAYASTRIKRSAAQAFAAETVETDEFVIQKPDGFLTVVNGDPQYAFEAYSKEFGTEDATEFRLGTATIKIMSASADADTEIRDSGAEIISDINEIIGENHYRLVEAKRIKKDIAFRVLYKTAEAGAKKYVLEINALANAPDEFSRKIESMLDSFEIK